MKKWIFLFIISAALTGCSLSKDNTDKKNTSDTQEEEQQEEEVAASAQDAVKLSEKLSDFQFAIQGQVYQLPMKMEELEALGWSYDGEAEKMIDADSFLEKEKMKMEHGTFAADIVNMETEAKSVSEVWLGGIVLERSENEDPSIYLPGNIEMGVSSLEDVLNAYGEATDQYEEEENIYLTYEYGLYKKADFVFDSQEEILYKADLKNYRAPSDDEEVSQEIPIEVQNYVRPEGLSEDILAFIVSFDEFYYHIPAPVSEFVNNGWTISEEGSDSSVTSGRHGYVTMEKDGQKLNAVVTNYSSTAVTIENTFVTMVHGDFDMTKVPIKVYRGITLGMLESTVIPLLDGIDYHMEEAEGRRNYYIYADEDQLDYLKISIDTDLELVREIEINNNPDVLLTDSIQSSAQEQEEATEATAMYPEDELPEDEE